jgi:hypothetical protein
MLESADIVEVGDLLRLAAAIDDQLALELAKAFGGQLADHCQRDGNLGRHAALLHGLHAASRQLSRELVSALYGPDADNERLLDMIDESESIDNINGLIQQVQEIDRTTAGYLLKVALETSHDRLLALAGVDANLQSTSRWLRTMHRQPSVVPSGLQEEVVDVMLKLREYDTRLFSAVEAAAALIDAGRLQEAHVFTTDVLKFARQAGSVRSIGAFINLCLMLMRMDQVLGTSCLHAVLGQISDSEVVSLLNLRDEPIAATFFHWLARHHIPQLIHQRELVFAQARADIVLPPPDEALGLVGMILLEQSSVAIRAAVDSLSQAQMHKWRPWEIGLVEVAWLASHCESSRPLIEPQLFWSGLTTEEEDAMSAARAESFGRDATNVKFGLALQSTVDCPTHGTARARILEEAKLRLASEIQSAVRLVLDPSYLATELGIYPYYLKALLENSTFLRQRFDWTDRVAVEVHRSVFETVL